MTDRPAPGSSTAAPPLDVTLWGSILIACIAAIAPAFDQDDVAFFNYMNNVIGARPVFYYLDYVPLAPELVAYVLRGLPFVVQALLYRVLPLSVVLVLYRELRVLLRRDADPVAAGVLALAAMLILRVIEDLIWANLTFVITPMFLAAAIHVMRVNRDGQRYSWWALGTIILAAVSVPFGALLVPLVLLQIPGATDPVQRRQNVTLAVAITAGYLLLNARVLGSAISVSNPRAIVATFLSGFRSDFRWNSVIACVSVLVLAGALVETIYRRRGRPELVMRAGLALIGIGAVAGVLVSDRLARGDGGFYAVYVLPPLLAAMIVVGQAVLRIADHARRMLALGICVGITGVAISMTVGPRLRGPLELTLMRYRFVMVAEAFRADCRAGDAMVFEHEDTSPVVLCQPREFPVGRHLQSEYLPSIGQRDPNALPDEQPVIVVGQPLF